ncbi:MAG TPA: lysophospholipid acyltransferase family protein [Rhodocyclaceae bacterium]|nr:lysophospholipid acyltransferase family protein [Rhodocyclaceae bacterium]
MLKRLPSHVVVALLWLLHWLPLPALAPVGQGFGMILYFLAGQRRHVAKVNLRLCFPELDEASRNRLARAHFRLLGRSLVERGILWWAGPARLKRLIRVEGEERLRALLDAGRPVILMTPHFLGLDAGGTGIVSRFDIVSIYARQKNPVIDRWLYHGRSRFGDQKLLSRNEGVRATVKAMKSGRPFYYLPDMNYRTRDAIFVPFFGVPAWTITGLSRLSRVTGATVISCVTRILPGGRGYVVELGDPWPDFPTDDVEADTTRMNREIEALVRTQPEQYHWVHRRLKTRPPGERSPY